VWFPTLKNRVSPAPSSALSPSGDEEALYTPSPLPPPSETPPPPPPQLLSIAIRVYRTVSAVISVAAISVCTAFLLLVISLVIVLFVMG